MLIEYHNSEYHCSKSYAYEFTDEIGNGFTFPCDKDGKVSPYTMSPEAYENYKKCLSKADSYYFHGVREYDDSYFEPPHGICECGEYIEFSRDNYFGAVHCPRCGKWYNLFGQELLPPEEWDYGYED